MNQSTNQMDLKKLDKGLKKGVRKELDGKGLPGLTEADVPSFIIGEYEGRRDSVNSLMLVMTGLSAVIAAGAFVVATVAAGGPADAEPLWSWIVFLVVNILVIVALLAVSVAAILILARQTERKAKVNAIVIRILIDRDSRKNKAPSQSVAYGTKVFALKHQVTCEKDAAKRPCPVQ